MNIEEPKQSRENLLDKLVEQPEKLKTLLEGCEFFSGEKDSPAEMLNAWENRNKFITQAIHKDGTILDFGSANGFLLKSLQFWSDKKLDPYGYDINSKAIEEARKLFPDKQTHFVTSEELEKDSSFPKKFDFVYWNVWDNYSFEDPKSLERLKKLLSHVDKNGRLILGFYLPSRAANTQKIETLCRHGIKISSVIDNPIGEEMLAWIQKEESQP